MTVRWVEGFEVRKNVAAFTQAYSQLAFGNGSITTGRLLGSAITNVGGTATTFTTPVFTAGDVWVVGCAYRRDDTSTTNRQVISLYDGASNRQITLATFVSGGLLKVEVYTDSSGGSSAWTAAGTFPLGQWLYFEFKVTVAPSTSGSFEVRINGGTILSQTSVNTANAGTSQADRVRFTCEGSATEAAFLDDIYVLDDAGAIRNNFLGDQVIEGLLPTSDGNSSQWTPSTGTDHFALVDDASGPDDDATYIHTAANDVTDLFGFANLSFITGNITAVMVSMNARILTAGSRTLRAVTRTGGTNYEGSDLGINSTGWQERQQIWEQNPDTVADWSVSEVNAAEFGVKAVA